jgi:hypothetical protein
LAELAGTAFDGGLTRTEFRLLVVDVSGAMTCEPGGKLFADCGCCSGGPPAAVCASETGGSCDRPEQPTAASKGEALQSWISCHPLKLR